MTLEQIARAIHDNANAVHDGKITWETFSDEQDRLWRLVDKDEPCVIGSDCDKRVMTVQNELKRLRK